MNFSLPWLCLTLLLLTPISIAAQDAKKKASPFKTTKEKVSYGIGQNVGKGLRSQQLDKELIDVKLFMEGFMDAFEGKDSKITEEELRAAFTEFQKVLQERIKKKAEDQKKVGEDYLAKNKTKEGVKTTKSGLQYKILKAGTGAIPKATDMVETHYKGTLIDGKEFDSSYKRGQPAKFPVTGVIKGWIEALQLMKVGAKWQLFIPSDLAYGERGGSGGAIGPNEVLIFELELLGIEK